MIAVVVPTIREEQFKVFRKAWGPLFQKHEVSLFPVFDGEPVKFLEAYTEPGAAVLRTGVPDEWKDVIFNLNDGVRNLGFLSALKSMGKRLDVIITLDDDVFPYNGNDPIEEHIEALYTSDGYSRRVPISWFSSASEYMRGFPYGVREEAEVWVSHGVWQGVHDYDGPTQLVNGVKPATFYRGPIPKGCLTNLCGMNLAFRVEALPYMYFSPMGKALGVQRFGDIWMGLRLKRNLDSANKAIVSGYSTVFHSRMSNVLENLEQEARGIKWNEALWQGNEEVCKHEGATEYFTMVNDCYDKWIKIVHGLMGEGKQ